MSIKFELVQSFIVELEACSGVDRQTDRISLYGASFVTVEAPLLRGQRASHEATKCDRL